jgi:S-disulfanyl-L-cysteine oxidoreductase SoxD
MCTLDRIAKTAGMLLALSVSSAAFGQTAPGHYGFGTDASPQDLANFYSITPDGAGLPPGSGNATAGAKVYADNCAACHGDKLQGNPAKGIGGDRLLGGRGTLASNAPIKTVESYWPYATTLFDYVKRAMPFNAPGSLNDNDVYAVVAYVLSEAKIIKPTDTMNATTLPKVTMPNRDGFIPDPRPELELYR